jgi:hypothetical protein
MNGLLLFLLIWFLPNLILCVANVIIEGELKVSDIPAYFGFIMSGLLGLMVLLIGLLCENEGD